MLMDNIETVFLSAVRCGLHSSIMENDPLLDEEGWNKLLTFADKHSLLPFVYNVVCKCPSFKENSSTTASFRSKALHIISNNVIQTNEFLTLILHARDLGFDPIVLKGCICKSLYPEFFLRSSSDDDLLVDMDEMPGFRKFLLSEGLSVDGYDDVDEALSYHRSDSPLYIELQEGLFSADSDAYGDLNELFEGMMDHHDTVWVQDVDLRTLEPTANLLYLICHAFKHFILSGFGIRVLCDIILFADHYAERIDWNLLRAKLEKAGLSVWSTALFSIGSEQLLPENRYSAEIEKWNIPVPDTKPLLDDILDAGVLGAGGIGRLHSSNITLNTMAQRKKTGTSSSTSFIRTGLQSVFLPFKQMAARYPYLRKVPFLLPFAWAQRLCKYLKERISAGSNRKDSAARSIRLGQNRVELLKKYGIIR